MKKNWTMKTGALLMALTLVTTCFVGGTLAKYVTSGEGKDIARVAKFGVNVTAEGTIFAKEYETDDASVAGTIAKSVESTEKVVAPGTKGDMTKVGLTGHPEVAVRVSHEAKMDLGAGWKDSEGKYYCPLVITVKDGEKDEQVINGLNFQTAAGFQAAVEKAVKEYSEEYKAGTYLGTVTENSLAISWEWPFSTSKANDVKDTYLGDQAAAGSASTVSLTVTTTVTQID